MIRMVNMDDLRMLGQYLASQADADTLAIELGGMAGSMASELLLVLLAVNEKLVNELHITRGRLDALEAVAEGGL